VLGNESAAEDAVQEAYIRAFTNLDRYQPTGAFGAWLTRIAINEALMLRRRIRRDTISLDDLDESALGRVQLSMVDLQAQADSMESISARELLEQAVEALPIPFRTVFILRVVEQMSIDETATCLGINESTVKTRLHRAHRMLRARLARRLRRERLNIFEFAGSRCDRIVERVLLRMNHGFPSAGMV
jgi:RNA polymerase sigma-70 factor (ECF subfamily)